ncbi:unnamed protein product [Prorocentrum cordatum]|uniref:BART domain-containing protein n=1 Tax=Prorocentrum cordatum TaxID=2364126 RepID=A0ABN9PSR5_9DINO|nr:unnamed protein product [Polarella glacialis]
MGAFTERLRLSGCLLWGWIVCSLEAFSLSVTGLPRRLAGDHPRYAERLAAHFDALLRAQVTDRSAQVGLLVVLCTDRGQAAPPLRSRLLPAACCCCDARGRRLGRILRIRRDACDVQWCPMPGCPPEVTACRIRTAAGGPSECDLLDARLLAQLEAAGCDLPGQPCGGGEAQRSLVHAVSLARDYGGILRAARLDAQQRTKQLEQEASGSPAGEPPPDRPQHASGAELSHEHVSLEIQRGPSAGLDLGDVDDRDVLVAFVTFTYARHRDFLLHGQYHCSNLALVRWLQPRRLRFSGHALRVEQAPAPSDIFWENIDFPASKRRARRRWVLLSCVALLAICTLLFSTAKKLAIAAQVSGAAGCPQETTTAQHAGPAHDCVCGGVGYRQIVQDEPPGIYDSCRSFLSTSLQADALAAAAAGMVVVVSVAATPLIVYIADWERPQSLTAQSHRVMSVVFFVQLINIGFMTLLVNFRSRINVLGGGLFGLIGDGDFSDFGFEWYAEVGASILLTMAINAVCPLLSVLWVWLLGARRQYCVRRLRAKPGHHRGRLFELHTPPEFELAVQHAQQLCAIFVTVMFSAGLPLLQPLLVVSLALFYWTDKFVLLRASRIPPRYKHGLALWCARLLPLALLAHSALAVWVFGNPRVSPSHPCREDIWPCGLLLGARAGASPLWAPALDRASAASALPSAAACAIVCALVLLRAARALLPGSLGLLPRLCCQRALAPAWGRGFLLNRAFGEEPLEELRRLKVAHSYEITGLPEFGFLGAAGGGGGGAGGGGGPEALGAAAVGDGAAAGSPPPSAGEGATGSPLKQELQALHPIAVKFAPELVDSALRSRGATEEVDDFIRLHCPRFRAFDVDGEFEVTMTEVHRLFCDTVEGLISARLEEMGLDLSLFEDILQLRAAADGDEDVALAALACTLARYTDFCSFGLLMRDRFLELYAAKPTAAASPPAGEPQSPPARTALCDADASVASPAAGAQAEADAPAALSFSSTCYRVPAETFSPPPPSPGRGANATSETEFEGGSYFAADGCLPLP